MTNEEHKAFVALLESIEEAARAMHEIAFQCRDAVSVLREKTLIARNVMIKDESINKT